MSDFSRDYSPERNSTRNRSPSPPPDAREQNDHENNNNSEKSKSSSVYLAKLPFRTNEQRIEEILSQFGTCENVNIIRDPHTNESRGFAFGKMSSHEEALKAVANLNGSKIEDKEIIAEIAQRANPYEKTPGKYMGKASNRRDIFHRDSFRPRDSFYSRSTDSYRPHRDSYRPPPRDTYHSSQNPNREAQGRGFDSYQRPSRNENFFPERSGDTRGERRGFSGDRERRERGSERRGFSSSDRGMEQRDSFKFRGGMEQRDNRDFQRGRGMDQRENNQDSAPRSRGSDRGRDSFRGNRSNNGPPNGFFNDKKVGGSW